MGRLSKRPIPRRTTDRSLGKFVQILFAQWIFIAIKLFWATELHLSPNVRCSTTNCTYNYRYVFT